MSEAASAPTSHAVELVPPSPASSSADTTRSTPKAIMLPEGYRLSTSPSEAKKALPQIIAGLLENPAVYWELQRTPEVVTRQVERAWKNHMILKEREGADGLELCAYARVISDGEQFAYLSDVVVGKCQKLPGHQKQGLGKAVVENAIKNSGDTPGRSHQWRWFAWTKDAHSLYAPFGFKPNVNGRAIEIATFAG